jgi:hypothetical protein
LKEAGAIEYGIEIAVFQQEFSHLHSGVIGVRKKRVLDDAAAATCLEHLDEVLEKEESSLARADGEILLHFPTLFAAKGRIGLRVYLDLLALANVRLKIFLRTDIWTRITTQGFREASHITRHVTISWNRNSLLNLVVHRALHNASIQEGFGVQDDLARRDVPEPERFFYRLYPGQVDVGPNKPNTIDWLLSRTRDGAKSNAPRELIHFLNSLREVQVKRFEIGEAAPEEEQLFGRPSFKDALPAVSKVRLEQTLHAEYPESQEWVEKLRGAKTLHTPETLVGIWNISGDDAIIQASRLVTVGFFERRACSRLQNIGCPFCIETHWTLSEIRRFRDQTGLILFRTEISGQTGRIP